MTRQLKARPTEYKGVVYRSKSEAMFARWLEIEITCLGLDGFCYEQKEFEVDGWVPDFTCWSVEKRDNQLSIRRVFIEYKPAMPTGTYLAELAIKFQELKEVATAPPIFPTVGLSVVCGGFFDVRQSWLHAKVIDGEIVFIDKGKWLDNDRKARILNTRFDLEERYGG